MPVPSALRALYIVAYKERCPLDDSTINALWDAASERGNLVGEADILRMERTVIAMRTKVLQDAPQN